MLNILGKRCTISVFYHDLIQIFLMVLQYVCFSFRTTGLDDPDIKKSLYAKQNCNFTDEFNVCVLYTYFEPLAWMYFLCDVRVF